MSFTCIDHSTDKVKVEIDTSKFNMPAVVAATPYDDTFIRDYLNLLQNEIGFLRDEVRDVNAPTAVFDSDWMAEQLNILNASLQAAIQKKDISQPAVNPASSPWTTAMIVTNEMIKTFSILTVAVLLSLIMIQYL